MLVWKSKMLNGQEINFTEQAVKIETEGMSREFGNKARTKPSKGTGMVALDVKLGDQLAMHGFTNFAPFGNAGLQGGG